MFNPSGSTCTDTSYTQQLVFVPLSFHFVKKKKSASFKFDHLVAQSAHAIYCAIDCRAAYSCEIGRKERVFSIQCWRSVVLEVGTSAVPLYSFLSPRLTTLPHKRLPRAGVFNLLSCRANLLFAYNPAGRSHCRLQNHHGYIKHNHRGMGSSPGDVGEVPMT